MRTWIACITAALALQAIEASASNLGALDLSSGSTGFGNTPVSGAFLDTYSFTVTTRATLNGSLISAINGTQDIDFNSISINGTSGPFSLALLNPDPFELWAVGAAGVVLDPGTYTMSLTGTNSAAIGSYGGNLAVTPLGAAPTLADAGVAGPQNFAAGFVDLTTGSAPLFNSPQTGAFIDTYSFILTTLSIVNGAFTSAVNGSQDVDFSSIFLSGPSGVFSYSLFGGDPVEWWGLPAAGDLLSPGLYTLSVAGVNSAAGGSYGGMFAATPSSGHVLPEPGSVALVVFALGACGVVSRGRRNAARRSGATVTA